MGEGKQEREREGRAREIAIYRVDMEVEEKWEGERWESESNGENEETKVTRVIDGGRG